MPSDIKRALEIAAADGDDSQCLGAKKAPQGKSNG